MEKLDMDFKELIRCPLWWHERGLMKYPHGGLKIETEYKVKHNGRIKRLYACTMSNVGLLFIMSKGKELHVEIDNWGKE